MPHSDKLAPAGRVADRSGCLVEQVPAPPCSLNGDVLLVSSNHHAWRVSSHLLRDSSCVLADMLAKMSASEEPLRIPLEGCSDDLVLNLLQVPSLQQASELPLCLRLQGLLLAGHLAGGLACVLAC